jgi:hypothetical protein
VNLSCRVLRQFGSEEDSLRYFVVGEPSSQVFPQFLFAKCCTFPYRDDRDDLFPIHRIGCPSDTCLEDSGVVIKHLFHLLWRDIPPSVNDDLLPTSLEPQIALAITGYQIPGV